MKCIKKSSIFQFLGALFIMVATAKNAWGQVEINNTAVSYKTLSQANTEYDNKMINKNLAVGAIEGKFEVTLSGAATYRIKPDMLPGIKNMIPNIEIIYSSQGGNSILGEGWSIQGLSAISRTSKDIYHNGKNESIKFNSSDYFSLDGQLISPYGNSGEYRTVNESYNIIYITWGYNGYSDCPNYFTVETKDGLILEYGNSNDSKVHTKSPKGTGTQNSVVAWKISKMTDKYGNYVLFKYKNIAPNAASSTTHIIDEISYTHNSALSTAVINKLRFNYKLRRDINSGFISGDEYNESYLLTSIETISNNSINNKMYFDYGYSENSSKVIEISKENKNGELLNSTKFKYNEIQVVPTQKTINNNVSGNENADERRYADFNGDGYSDYITTYKTTDPNDNKKYIDKHEIFINNKVGGFTLFKTINNVYELNRTFALNPVSHSRLVVDVNGDNLQDILFFKINNGSQKIVQYYYMYYDQVTNQFKESERTIVHLGKVATFPNYDYNPISNPDYVMTGEEWQTIPNGKNWINLGDYDGDGRTEMVLNVEFKLIETWTNTQTGSSGVQYVNYAQVYTFLIDPNIPTINSSNIITYPSAVLSANTLTTTDIDGDNRQEILLLDTKTVYEYDEVSKSFIVKKSGLNIPGIPNMNTRIELGDFNGDRKTDILYYENVIQDVASNSSSTYNFNRFYDIYYSNGIDYLSPRRSLNIPSSYADWSDCDLGVPNPDDPGFTIKDAIKSVRDFVVSDFNYDGRTDIVEYLTIEKCVNNNIYSNVLERIYYSNGNGFDVYAISNTPFNSKASINSQDKRKLGDYNGDGFIDIFNHGTNTTYISQFNLSNSSNPKSSSCRLLAGIKNGYNYEIKVDYDRLTNSVYSNQYRTCSYPQAFNFKIPARVVSAYQIPDGIGGVVNNTYMYHDLYFDFQSGFKGFGKVIAKAVPTNTYVETWLTYNKDYKQLYTSRLENGIIQNGGLEAISHTSYEMEWKDYSNATSGIGAKRFIQLPSKITKYYYLTQHEGYTSYSYDSKANEYRLLSTTENTNNGLNTQVTQLLNYGAFGTTMSNKPQIISKTNTRLGKPAISIEQNFGYNSTTGDIEYEVINKGLPCETKISYTYDVVGNLWKKTTLPTGSSASAATVARTEESSYDPSKRFVEKKYNVMGQLTNTTLYDPISGVPTSSVDMNGEQTLYEYDHWNKLKKTQIPARGLTSTIDFYWNPNSGDYMYYTLEQATNSPATTKNYDVLGRMVSKASTGRFGKPIAYHVSYNAKGQKYYETNEYYTTENPFETTTVYDDYGRVASVTNPNGTTSIGYTYDQSLGIAEVSTTNPQGQIKKTFVDASGKTFKIEDIHGKTILHEYNSLGQLLNTKLDGVKTIEYEYDACGQLEKQIDKANGTTDYTYDEWGQLKSKRNARNQTESYVYDDYGRKIQRTNPEGVTTYTYVPFSSPGRNQIWKIFTLATNTKNNVRETYRYDARGNVKSMAKNIGGVHMSVNYIYHPNFNLVTSKSYSSGVVLNYQYDSYNMLERITSGGTTIYQLQDVNSYDKPTQYALGNGLTTSNGYDQNYPVSAVTNLGSGSIFTPWLFSSPLLDYQVSIDKPSGNVQSRSFSTTTPSILTTPTISGFSESFIYDSKDRLTSSEIGGRYLHINYDAQEKGNIVDKDDVGTYHYDAGGKNQVVEIENPTGAISSITQMVDYTSFEQPCTLVEGDHKLFIQYSDQQQRIRGIWFRNQPVPGQNPNGRNDVLHRLRYYFGDMEINVEQDRSNPAQYNADYIHYVYGIDGHMVAIIKNHAKNFDAQSALNTSTSDITLGDNATIDPSSTNLSGFNNPNRLPDEYYYTYTDHLGSILVVTDQLGGIVATQNFDAWGRYRDMYTSGSFIASTGNPSWLYRGYTGHEHLDEFVLINMNGRLYDPVVARFLSTDLYINDPENSNTYNRYTYCLNNPLKYTDPSGEVVESILVPIIVGAIIGGASYTLLQANGNWNLKDFMQSVIIGAISGAVSYGVGEVVTGMGVNGASHALVSALLHGGSQVGVSIYSGLIFHNQFIGTEQMASTFITSALSSLVGSVGDGVGAINGMEGLGSMISTAGAGSLSAYVSGDDPVKAVARSLIVNLTNHGLHMTLNKAFLPSVDELSAFYPEDIATGEQVSSADAYNYVGGDVAKFYNDYVARTGSAPNACALRLSIAFNDAGVKIPKNGNTYKGANGSYYFLSAFKMYNWIVNNFQGNVINNNNADFNRFSGRGGIYFMRPTSQRDFGATGHISIFNYGRVAGGHDYLLHPLYHSSSLFHW